MLFLCCDLLLKLALLESALSLLSQAEVSYVDSAHAAGSREPHPMLKPSAIEQPLAWPLHQPWETSMKMSRIQKEENPTFFPPLAPLKLSRLDLQPLGHPAQEEQSIASCRMNAGYFSGCISGEPTGWL